MLYEVITLTCYLLERSLKTLAVRVEKQNQNARVIAEYLQKDPRIQNVYYPGLENHPAHAVAKNQMKGYGGMLAFELNSRAPDPVITSYSIHYTKLYEVSRMTTFRL